MLKSSLQCMVSGVKSFKEAIRSQRRNTQEWNCSSYEKGETPRQLPLSLSHFHYVRKKERGTWKPRREISPEPQQAGTMISHFQAPES